MRLGNAVNPRSWYPYSLVSHRADSERGLQLPCNSTAPLWSKKRRHDRHVRQSIKSQASWSLSVRSWRCVADHDTNHISGMSPAPHGELLIVISSGTVLASVSDSYNAQLQEVRLLGKVHFCCSADAVKDKYLSECKPPAFARLFSMYILIDTCRRLVELSFKILRVFLARSNADEAPSPQATLGSTPLSRKPKAINPHLTYLLRHIILATS